MQTIPWPTVLDMRHWPHLAVSDRHGMHNVNAAMPRTVMSGAAPAFNWKPSAVSQTVHIVLSAPCLRLLLAGDRHTR